MTTRVQALQHLTHTIGSLSVNRLTSTFFDMDDAEAQTAAAAGLVRIMPKQPTQVKPNTPANPATKPPSAAHRLTKVTVPTSTKSE